jgi:hypothetical protein
MVAIRSGVPEIRALRMQPYDSAEMLDAALQAFPMLVLAEGVVGYSEQDVRGARRTVIGQDAAGRIILLLATRSRFTLSELSSYLAHSDLGLTVALNLDGGTSSGLIMAEPYTLIPAFSPLPIVLTIKPR